MTDQLAPPGWYADPSGRFEYRYWDGSAWSEHVSRAGVQAVDPPTGAPAAGATAAQPTPAQPTSAAPIAAQPNEMTAWPPIETAAATPAPEARASGWVEPPRAEDGTEPFSIVSFVAGLAGLVVVGIGSVVAIVFGHIARSRIKRSGKDGKGLALAGLILGYLEIVAAIAGIVVFVVFVVSAFNDAHDTARGLGRQIYVEAARQGTTPRSGSVIRRATRDLGLTGDRVLVGSTGEHASAATDADLASEGWKLEVHRGTFGQACLTVPSTSSGTTEISTGSC